MSEPFAGLTHGERVLNSVDPKATIEQMSSSDLAELLSELQQRKWFNGFWNEIHARALAECALRFMEISLPGVRKDGDE